MNVELYLSTLNDVSDDLLFYISYASVCMSVNTQVVHSLVFDTHTYTHLSHFEQINFNYDNLLAYIAFTQ